MSITTVCNSTIAGIGVEIPQQIVTTEQVVDRFRDHYGISGTHIERITGIKEKRRCAEGEHGAGLAIKAARKAMDQAGILPKDVQMIINGGLTKLWHEPATASLIQAELGADDSIWIDCPNACHGFATGVGIADAYLSAFASIENILVLAGEQGSLFEDLAVDALLKQAPDKARLRDMLAGLTLGDGGGAIVMQRKRDPEIGFIASEMTMLGKHSGLCVSGGPSEHGPLVTKMAELMKEASAVVTDRFYKFMDAQRWDKNELAAIIPHQTGLGMFKLYEERFGLPSQVFKHSVAEYGNLIAASVPINLERHSHDACVGEKCLISVQGSGLAVSLTTMTWPELKN